MASKTIIQKNMVVSDVKLTNKTVVITGANTGIGYETALDLAGRGAKVIMTCRDTAKAEDAKAKILEQVADANLIVKKLDLASLESIRECAKEINETEERLDILINNAGVMMCPEWKTKDGFEMQIGVNHIGHFLFTTLLLDLIKKSAPSRIVILSSLAHEFGKMNWDDLMSEKRYDCVEAYGQSKLANVHFGTELSRRLEGTGVTTYIVHPGYVRTELDRHLKQDNSHMSFKWRFFSRIYSIFSSPIAPKEGAQTSIYCAIAPELQETSGKYYYQCKEKIPASLARKPEDAKRLWDITEEWIKEKPAEQTAE